MNIQFITWNMRFLVHKLWELIALLGRVLSVHLGSAFAFYKRTFCIFSSFFFFFWHTFWPIFLLFIHCCATIFDFFSWTVHTIYCLWTHKLHFSATFSLKMGLTVLFTHLKIILLQCFSVFSFSFQFSTVSKRTLSKWYSCRFVVLGDLV